MPRHVIAPLPVRFWSHVATGTGDECWPWLGMRHSDGYGRFSLRSDRREPDRPERVAYERAYAHRLAYELVYGPVPDGLEVLHRCDNPCCCSPYHLWVGTKGDNLRDAWQKGRRKAGRR